MALILNIETATDVCTLTIARDGKPWFERRCDTAQNHAVQLPLFVDEAMEALNVSNEKLDAVAISAGPGSYTGLRIGASTAKGICYALKCPLISIDTLQIIALGAQATEGLVRPMIDARRMEVYSALYTHDGKRVCEPEALIIDEHSFADELQKGIVTMCGNGAEKCVPVIQHPNIRFVANIVPTANLMCQVAEQKYNEKAFEDVAYYEPFYLKEYMAIKPKKLF